MDILRYFTDPLLQTSMVGTILMCLSSSLIGVMTVVRRESLVGETLSHAAFPGAVVGVIVGMQLFAGSEFARLTLLIISALVFSMAGLAMVGVLKHRFRVKEDAALVFVLSTLVGVGVLLTSYLQATHPLWFREVQSFFYGQAATMLPVHVFFYGLLTLCSLGFILAFFPRLKMVNFDRGFSRSLGINVALVDALLVFFIAFAVVIGIKAVGVVLMSGMLIAPAVAARRWAKKLSTVTLLAAIFGVVSAFVGNLLSYEVPKLYGGSHFNLPTGPLILLTAAVIAIFSLKFAPSSGFVIKALKNWRFRQRTFEDNFIKAFWKWGIDEGYQASTLRKMTGLSRVQFIVFALKLRCLGMIMWQGGMWRLTEAGKKRAAYIVRVHRLFELYLSNHLKIDAHQVHHIAEEMEHYITPEIERELAEFLGNPKSDPHSQPIPEESIDVRSD